MSLRKRVQELATEQDVVVEEVENTEVNEDAPVELQEAMNEADKEIAIQEEADLVASNIEEVQGGIQATLDSEEEVSDVDVAVAEAHLQQIAIRAGFINSLTCESIEYVKDGVRESLSLESYNYASNNREKLENINLALEGIWGSIKKVGSDIYTWIKNLLKKFWNWVTGWFKPSSKKINDNIMKIQKEHDEKIKAEAKNSEDEERDLLVDKIQKVFESFDNKDKRKNSKAFNYLEQAFKFSHKVRILAPAVTEHYEILTGAKKWDINEYKKLTKQRKLTSLWSFPSTYRISTGLENVADNDTVFLTKEAYDGIMELLRTDNDYQEFMDSSVKLLSAKSLFDYTLPKTIDNMKKGIESATKEMEKEIEKWKKNLADDKKTLLGINGEKVVDASGKTLTIDDVIQGQYRALKITNKLAEYAIRMYYNLSKTVEAIAENKDSKLFKTQKEFDDFMMSDEPLKL